MKEIQHALTVHGKFIKHLFSAEIHLFFLICFFSSHYMDIRYVTLRYISTIHYCTKLLIFFCVEMFTRVCERQERNDFNEHKMMMMTGKWDNKVCRNSDF